MLFWFVAVLLTLGASLAVLLPLTRRPAADAGDAAHDLEVYRDQLAELDRDAARGLIAPSETEQARVEIARRILKADARPKVLRQSVGNISRLFGAAAVLAVPLLSWGIYGAIGSPDLPSQPLAERLAKSPASSTVEELVARAETHLVANPNDGKGWDVLAPIYVRLGRYEEAVAAYRNALRLDGDTGARHAGLGEALTDVAQGAVSPEAVASFRTALRFEPNQPKASFYIATALAQQGRMPEAIAGWQAMLASLPAESPWRGAADQAIAEAQSRMAANQAPGPTSGDVEAAAGMSGSDRTAMIESMVAGLDEKLRQNPGDLEGWTRLVRSYVVLGRQDAARDAVKRGTDALGPGSTAAQQLLAFSGTLGITASE